MSLLSIAVPGIKFLLFPFVLSLLEYNCWEHLSCLQLCFKLPLFEWGNPSSAHCAESVFLTVYWYKTEPFTLEGFSIALFCIFSVQIIWFRYPKTTSLTQICFYRFFPYFFCVCVRVCWFYCLCCCVAGCICSALSTSCISELLYLIMKAHPYTALSLDIYSLLIHGCSAKITDCSAAEGKPKSNPETEWLEVLPAC